MFGCEILCQAATFSLLNVYGLKVNCDKHLHGGLHNLAQNFLFGVSPLFAFFFLVFQTLLLDYFVILAFQMVFLDI